MFKICNNVKFISKQYSIIIVINCKNIGGIVMYTLINELLKNYSTWRQAIMK